MNDDAKQPPARFDYDTNDINEITRRIRLAARLAMIDHKLKGHAIVEMIDGQIVRTEAEDIVIPDEDEINGTTQR